MTADKHPGNILDKESWTLGSADLLASCFTLKSLFFFFFLARKYNNCSVIETISKKAAQLFFLEIETSPTKGEGTRDKKDAKSRDRT